jgi:PAS domain S-box-containing protein
VVEWNAAAERLFGRGREQVLGRPVAEAVRAADGPADWAAILATTGTGVFRFAGADGAFDAELFLVRFVQDGREIRTLVVHDVSARRSIEQRLQQERDYATAVLNSIPGTFYHFDEDLRLLRWNRNFERVTGYCADELATMHPLDFYPEENKALVAEKIAEVFERGEARVEVEFVAKSGERLHYLVTGVRFEHGGRRQLLGIGIDISERRRMEDALRDSLARFDAVARATGDAVWDLDLATHESWRNENYHVQFGGPGAEIAPAVGSWEERIHPDDRERVLARIRAAIAGDGDIWFDEYRMRRGDGSYAEVFDRGIVLRDAAGAGVRMVGAMQDVTERKRAEQAIRDSLARFDAAARATGDVIWDWDLASGAIWWSENFRLLFGYSADEIEPTMASWTERIHPDDREHVVARVREVVDGAGNLWEDEYRFRRKDGSWAFLLDRGYVLRDASGRGVRMIGAMQDITEQVRAETQLRALNDELERRVAHRTRELEAVNKELESFSYSVSHDLRAPLRGIAGFAEILVKNHADRLDDRARDYLGRVQAATHRMGELIDDLLKLSRVSRDEMRRETVDLSAIARDVLARLQQDAPERRVETAVEDGLVAEGDARLLRVVLENLLGNAWKFTARTPGARISFSADEQDGIRCFAVGDNGAGFDMRYADKLFGPFQRLHRVSEFPGTGIGLATVQRVLIRHGGRIWAQAEPGRGAIFRFVV